MRILDVVGARPNFMKVAPVHAALLRHGHDAKLIHTGQHYDANMSDVFFTELGMPRPDRSLNVGSGTHAVQTARILEAFEAVLLEERPELVLVAGDVNSTLACALAATKLHVRVAHLEAGLRSDDRRMPEEINRIVTDHIADVLLTPSADGDANLRREGIAESKIFRVGNAMIDSLLQHLERARATDALGRLGLKRRGYALTTLHRPENVDSPEILRALLGALVELAREVPVVFPAHPRTRKQIHDAGMEQLVEGASGLRIVEPLGYLEFLALEADAALVLSDSGGVQEETTALGVPCLTLRENTERPITVSEGTNTMVGSDLQAIRSGVAEILAGRGKRGRVPENWDGRAAERIAADLYRWLQAGAR